MSAIDDVITVMTGLPERDRQVIADLVHLFAVGDRTRIDAVQAALDCGDAERVRQLLD